MKGFSNKFEDFPDYIIKITKEIWEDRGVETLNRYYSDDIPVWHRGKCVPQRVPLYWRADIRL